MLLLAGLGNPGAKYAGNRHNIGFMAIDRIADRYGFSDFRKKFHGALAQGDLDGEKTLLLKPQTFMNESGISLAEAVTFHKIPLARVVVFYDELDLPSGKLRMKCGGGLAGHNGVRSVRAHIGDAFRRARLGIGHPGDKARVLSYVLGDFAKADALWLDALLESLARHAGLLARDDDATYQNYVHMDMEKGAVRDGV